MKIRLNGGLDLRQYDIYFRNLDIELVDDNEHTYEEFDDELDFNELIALDEYLEEMIEDYVEIIEYTDIDVREALVSMVFELLDLGL
ncbi:MAG TPA: hypothetical protein VK982_14080 [Bacteroidales bacterium]|nr:hypothetical protein [Bacteroidales bacterium]